MQPTEQQVRVGVVGGGLIAQVSHLPLLSEHVGRFAIAALAEPSPRTRRRLAERYRIPATYPDHRAMLGGVPDLDAVLICSPTGAHAEGVLDALDAGCHVLVEKPLCITCADADRIIERRDASGLTVQVGYMKRFDPAYEAFLDDLRPSQTRIHHIATTTYDPGLARYFTPADSLSTDDVPEVERRRQEELTAAQVKEAVGSDDPDRVFEFSVTFLAALVHDVNLVHGALDRLGLSDGGKVIDACAGAAGDVGFGCVALAGGQRWTMTWMHVPGLHDFREDLALYSADAVRLIRFPAPYARGTTGTFEVLTPGRERCESRRVRSYEGSYARQLVQFHDCVVQGATCRTPPEQARADIELLTRLYLRHLRNGTAPSVAAGGR